MEPDTFMQNIIEHDLPILHAAAIAMRVSAGVSGAMLLGWLVGALPFVACLIPIGLAVAVGMMTAFALAYRSLKRDGATAIERNLPTLSDMVRRTRRR